jgi:hypothetical protein
MKGIQLRSLGISICVAFCFAPIFGSSAAHAACLENQADRTVYVTLQSSRGQQTGSLMVGNRLCVPTGKGKKAVAKIVPYGGARFGCKAEIVGDETAVLTRFGTMNDCDFVPGQ